MRSMNYWLVALSLLALMSCGRAGVTSDDEQYEFAKGADVSWVTEMESKGVKFYDYAGNESECIALMKSLGMDAIRLRVWVDPEDGWCNREDVLAKALRAHRLGMRLMIDFHYSDSWADPGKQYKPAAWNGLDRNGIKEAVAGHTVEVLSLLKDNGVTPEWVQVGNEVGPGMLWDIDREISGATYDVEKDDLTYPANEANFAAYVTAGYNAVKKVFPNAKVIVHVQEGNRNDLFRWLFDILEKYNASYDVIGISLYPPADGWESVLNAAVSNLMDMTARYGKEVMVCETGMPWDRAEAARAYLTALLEKTSSIDGCLGVFYWEPECYGGWNGYSLGAFDENGRPTAAMEAFR